MFEEIKEGEDEDEENDEVGQKRSYMLTSNNEENKNAESPMDASGGANPAR